MGFRAASTFRRSIKTLQAITCICERKKTEHRARHRRARPPQSRLFPAASGVAPRPHPPSIRPTKLWQGLPAEGKRTSGCRAFGPLRPPQPDHPPPVGHQGPCCSGHRPACTPHPRTPGRGAHGPEGLIHRGQTRVELHDRAGAQAGAGTWGLERSTAATAAALCSIAWCSASVRHG